jgi:hypothetical protein
MGIGTLAGVGRRLLAATLLTSAVVLPVVAPAGAAPDEPGGKPGRAELSEAALAFFAPGPSPTLQVAAAGSGSFTDPAGDTTRYDECHADIRSFTADYGTAGIDVAVTMTCGSNPHVDPNWHPGVSAIMFAFDTNLDGVPDHAAFYLDDGGGLIGEVVRFGPTGDTTTCTGLAPGWNGSNRYSLRIDPDCIGAPMSFRYGVLASWDDDPTASGCLCPVDGAPDGELTPPIHGPVIPSPLGDGPGAASAGPGAVDVFARGQDDGLWFRRSQAGAWGGWSTLGGRITSSPAAASRGPGLLDVFARGGDGALWTRHFDGSAWGPWRSLGGILSSGPAAVSSAGTLHVFARGADGAVWTRRFDGSAWSPWSSRGGLIRGAPAAASPADGQLVVLARGGDDALWGQTFDGTAWGSWVALGGLITSAPGAAASGPGQVEVFARGGDNALWTRRSDTGLWTPWSTLGGGLTSPPAPVSAAEGTVDVFARGRDAALWTRNRSTSWSPWTTLGGRIR